MDSNLDKNELVDKIMQNENLHPGDKISYDRLVELSDKYNITPYTLATNIFGVTQAQFRSVHSKGSNAKNFIILKHLIPETIEKSISFRDTILQEEHLTIGDLINYNQLQHISKKYNIPEKILAVNVLQISEFSYRKIRNNPKENAIIFFRQKQKHNQTDSKKDNNLRQKILKKEGLKIGDKINYEKLTQLAKKYKIDEKKLAMDILGISLRAFYHICSDRKKNAIILKGFLNDEEELKRFSMKILSMEDIRPYSQIDYKTLQRLSEKYSINEKNLALYILGLTESQYWNIKYDPNKKAYVLKGEYRETNPKELRNLKLRIFEQEGLSAGKRIYYEEIETIQKKYDVSLDELLYILGITKQAYFFIKRERRYCSIVKDMDTYLTTQILSEIMEKGRYYTKDEIEQICKTNDISLQDFFDYILGKALYFGHDSYKNLLNSKGKIWIGDKCKLSDEFVNQNIEFIRKIAKEVSNHIYYNYRSKKRKIEKDDIEQEAVVFIIENCGDLEKNFEDDELSRMIYLRTRINMLKFIGTESKAVSISGYYQIAKDRSVKGNEKNVDLEVKDEKANTEEEAINKLERENQEDSIIGYLSRLVEEGYDRSSALEKTSIKFGIDKKTMLEALKEELLKRGKVKKTEKGEYILGD